VQVIWGPTHTVRVCESSLRGLLYGTDDYVKAPHTVHSGANFTVCSARSLGLVVIHIALPSIYAFDSLCSCENWKYLLLSQNVISSFGLNCVRQVQLETVQGCLYMKALQQLEKH
jgi:hypothetical protein